jgi:O-succinylbenzoic acid--CoA ligase
LNGLLAPSADVPALVTSRGDALSYDALHAAVARAAAQLPAAAIAVAVPDPAGFVVAALGVLAAGGVLVPTRSDEVARRAGAALTVTGATLDGALETAPVPPAPTIIGATPASPARAYDPCATPSSPARAHDPRAALILATSGTTGAPRLVVHSRDGLAANVAAILDYLPVRAHPRTAVVLPLHYAYALVGQCLVGLAAGATLLLLGDLRFPAAQAEAMARFGAEGLSSVPASLRLLAEAGAPPLAYVASAGAPVDPAALRAWFPGARLFNQWGLTEAGPRVTAVGDTSEAFDAGAVGRPIAGAEVAARRPDGTPCAPGELGELYVRGPSLMLGYLDEPSPLGPHGLRTGDLGRIDERGHVFLAGRADDVVKVAGERVGLDEVGALVARLPGVLEAAAAAVPDRWTGNRLEAAVVLAPGADLADVRRAARAALPPARRPARLVAVPSLPRTARGKLDREALRHLIEEP